MKHALLHLLLLGAQIGSGSADWYFTNRNARLTPFVEHNSIARPFVTHGPIERAAYFCASVGLAILGAELLDHFGQSQLSFALRGAQVYANTNGALFSAQHYKPARPISSPSP